MRKNISTESAPKAIGPYAQAVVASAERPGLLFGTDPARSEDAARWSARATSASRRERVLENLGAVLAAAGASFASVVKTTIFLADLQDFGTVNEVYARYFGQALPARATVQAAGLPKGALVEIDAIATVD